MNILSTMFNSVFNMTRLGIILFLVILIGRYMLSRFPKIYSYILWAALFIRLIIPINLNIHPSLFTFKIFNKPINTDIIKNIGNDKTREYISNNLNIEAFDLSRKKIEYILWIAIILWVIGIIILSLHTIISYIKMKRKISTATLIRDNVYETDKIESPFVFGIIRPKIYLPLGIRESEQQYLIYHEEVHIKRCDYIIKQIYFIAVIIHWFNPIVWKAFELMTQDMEMSCDERVMKDFKYDIKVEYSNSLLEFARTSSLDLVCPLAFGENHAKKRIENILKYKKMVYKMPKIILIGFVFWAVFFISNPTARQIYDEDPLSLGQMSVDYTAQDSEIDYMYDKNLFYIRESIANFKSTGEIKDIYVFNIKSIENNIVVGFVDHSIDGKTGVCVFEKDKYKLRSLYIEFGKIYIKHDNYDIMGGNFVIDYGKNLDKKALVTLSNGITSIKSNVYLDKKVVETKETTLNEPDMTIIDLSKYNYKDLGFEYFDWNGNKINM